MKYELEFIKLIMSRSKSLLISCISFKAIVHYSSYSFLVSTPLNSVTSRFATFLDPRYEEVPAAKEQFVS
jgi:ribonucleotide reductase beta subunit family protein with ferritin-like domain